MQSKDTPKTSFEEVRKTIEPLGYYNLSYHEFKKASRLKYIHGKIICVLTYSVHLSDCTLEEVLQGILSESELLKLGMKPMRKREAVV